MKELSLYGNDILFEIKSTAQNNKLSTLLWDRSLKNNFVQYFHPSSICKPFDIVGWWWETLVLFNSVFNKGIGIVRTR